MASEVVKGVDDQTSASLLAAARVLEAMHRTNKSMRSATRDAWDALLLKVGVPDEARESAVFSALDARARVWLLLGRRCTKCGRRARFVHWPFALRWCMPCFVQAAISRERLRADYGITEVAGACTLEGFHLVEDVERWLGCTLPKHLERVQERMQRAVAVALDMDAAYVASVSPTFASLCAYTFDPAEALRLVRLDVAHAQYEDVCAHGGDLSRWTLCDVGMLRTLQLQCMHRCWRTLKACACVVGKDSTPVVQVQVRAQALYNSLLNGKGVAMPALVEAVRASEALAFQCRLLRSTGTVGLVHLGNGMSTAECVAAVAACVRGHADLVQRRSRCLPSDVAAVRSLQEDVSEERSAGDVIVAAQHHVEQVVRTERMACTLPSSYGKRAAMWMVNPCRYTQAQQVMSAVQPSALSCALCGKRFATCTRMMQHAFDKHLLQYTVDVGQWEQVRAACMRDLPLEKV